WAASSTAVARLVACTASKWTIGSSASSASPSASKWSIAVRSTSARRSGPGAIGATGWRAGSAGRAPGAGAAACSQSPTGRRRRPLLHGLLHLLLRHVAHVVGEAEAVAVGVFDHEHAVAPELIARLLRDRDAARPRALAQLVDAVRDVDIQREPGRAHALPTGG